MEEGKLYFAVLLGEEGTDWLSLQRSSNTTLSII